MQRKCNQREIFAFQQGARGEFRNPDPLPEASLVFRKSVTLWLSFPETLAWQALGCCSRNGPDGPGPGSCGHRSGQMPIYRTQVREPLPERIPAVAPGGKLPKVFV